GGVPAAAAGNIGLTLIEAVGNVPKHGAIAVEVSSFQLYAIDSFRPDVAILLNVAEDHTDWHRSFEAYAAAKARIVKNQSSDDAFVVNRDDAVAAKIAATAPSRTIPFSGRGPAPEGMGVDGGALRWRGRPLVDLGDIPLPGLAGVEDAAAAAAAALTFGVDETAVVRAIK